MHYCASDVSTGGGEDELFKLLARMDRQRGTAGNRVFYLAVPPTAFTMLVDRLGHHRNEWSGWTRLIVEKPFGHDRDSARALNAEIKRHFAEREIYRIDHYLGKETVQNLLALRFANGIFEPIWNRQFVDHVEITVAESIGIEGRARSTRGGRDPGRLPEPPAAARGADRDGAAGRLHARVRARTRK